MVQFSVFWKGTASETAFYTIFVGFGSVVEFVFISFLETVLVSSNPVSIGQYRIWKWFDL